MKLKTATMDVIDAIMTRRSIRAFKPDPVPQEILREILTVARMAPSWSNTQPWEFAVVGGLVMEELKKALHERASLGEKGHPDIPYPDPFPEAHRQRSRDLGWKLYAALGIEREDWDKRRAHSLKGNRLFDAPNAIIVYMDKSLGPWSILDCGAVMQTIMLAAVAYGLGTCPEVQGVVYPEELRRILHIPPTKQIICSIAIGYADTSALENNFPRPREPLEVLATWHGF